MELRQVRYFVAVAETGTFTAAAERLGIVQSAVSQQVARLEIALGVALFDRTRRSPVLTGAGLRFLAAARDLLAAEEAARVAATRPPATPRPLRLGIPGALFRIPSAREADRPGIEAIAVPSEQREGRVASGELDAAIVHGQLQRSDLVALPLDDARVVAVLSERHPLAASKRVELTDLASSPFLVAEQALGSRLVQTVLRACRARGIEPALGSVDVATGALAAVVARPEAWSVFYADQAALVNADALGVRFVPLVPALTVPTLLVATPEGSQRAAELAAALVLPLSRGR